MSDIFLSFLKQFYNLFQLKVFQCIHILKNTIWLHVILHHLSACVCVQEAVGDTLEELWISYNLIEKLKGIQCMKNLKVLYMSNNLVKEWGKPHS